ncbi:MAG: nucleotide sugar dehydrogenase [Bacteroidales bacterium]|nr:nucleotide sugar dehydrogenase [Bacteroidales bacterium]
MAHELPKINELHIAVIGLGYVGLPLAVEFAKKFPVIGFDIKEERISELLAGHDSTLEVEDSNLQSVIVRAPESETATGLYLTKNIEELKICNVFIVTVPTPVDKNNRPDLTPLIKASETVGRVISKGGIVIYESTVYPGCTEDDCIPVIERVSGMKFQADFFAGYSPERINPGDKVNTVLTIKKITSGSTPAAADLIDRLYNSILKNGTHKAPSIKVAEAAKVIENSQRDINIAFMNELAKICSYFEIDTTDVLEAAGTKWNFLKFKPGLVGGHCIGIDPYYIAEKAEEAGYHPEIILAGRRMNDGMGAWIARRIVKMMIGKEILVKGSRVLVLGITFKENCPDIRNSKVIDLIRELRSFGCSVDVYDPWADADEVRHEYGLNLIDLSLPIQVTDAYQALVLAVAHDEFKTVDLSVKPEKLIIYDIKALLPRNSVDGRL